jgi:hypothetical protein
MLDPPDSARIDPHGLEVVPGDLLADNLDLVGDPGAGPAVLCQGSQHNNGRISIVAPKASGKYVHLAPAKSLASGDIGQEEVVDRPLAVGNIRPDAHTGTAVEQVDQLGARGTHPADRT